ncbi:PDDEXK-like family protein [Asticcacaulis endophyticus]|nr:PD-(D/E)XK nuclease family protein [Asticcacaulis endophyticus]
MTGNLETDELEALFVNNAGMDQLGAYLNRFNPIRIMKMEGMEIRHSSILSWLMSPLETHGLGDRFLKAFLSEVLRGKRWQDKPTALDIVQADLRDVEVRREWQNIDIFVFSPKYKWAFVIENKYYNRQHEGQLVKYAEKVRSIYPDMTVRGIFLTLLEEEPHDPAYVPISYETVAEILSPMVAQAGQALGAEVTTFLRHYIEIIEEETGMSQDQNDMEQLARDLYRTHKKVLDFIMEHGAATDFIIAAEALFGENLESGGITETGHGRFMYDWHNHWKYSFLPESWFTNLGSGLCSWAGCEKWWAGYPMICWFRLETGEDGTKGKLRLIAEVGPIADSKFRADIIERIKSLAEAQDLKDIRFQSGAAEAGKKYSKFLKNNAVDIDNIQDAKEISDAMIKLLARFAPYFEAIAEILPEFRPYGQSVAS